MLPGVVLDAGVQLERRQFEARRLDRGMVVDRFLLPGLEGEGVLAAVEALMPLPGDDGRTGAVAERLGTKSRLSP